MLPFSGTFTIVPSSILSRACCTPSPLTSLDEEDLVLLATLSISSMYTIPLSARCRLCPAACSSLLRMFSTSSPTYPAWVSAVASLSTSGTFTSLAMHCARRVFPEPVGPSITNCRLFVLLGLARLNGAQGVMAARPVQGVLKR